MKRGVQQREKKELSATGLLRRARKVFEAIPDEAINTRGRPRTISLADCLTSGLAMFSLKSPSLLVFDAIRRDEMTEHNLKKLYEIKQVPSDTYMRQKLDKVDPTTLRNGFLSIFEAIQRGNLLKRYEFLGGYLLLIDGTTYLTSNNNTLDSF